MDRILFGYLLMVNVMTFIVFGADKWKAVHGKWRIRESILLGLSLAGGAAGGLAAMYLFRHKIRKTRFKLWMPVMFIVQAVFLFYFTPIFTIFCSRFISGIKFIIETVIG